jgi:PAS domain S-box-containing protein
MLEAVFAAAPEAQLVIDANGTILLANRRAEELFADAPEALLGRSVDTLVPMALAERHGRHRAAFHSAARARPMGEGLDLRGRRADAARRPPAVPRRARRADRRAQPARLQPPARAGARADPPPRIATALMLIDFDGFSRAGGDAVRVAGVISDDAVT